MLVDRWLIRRQLVRLARFALAGSAPADWIPGLLAELAPQLPREVAAERFFDLVSAVLMRDRWPDRETRAQVRTALDALTGGAP